MFMSHEGDEGARDSRPASERGVGVASVFVHPTLTGLIVLTWHKNGNAEVSPGVMRNIAKIAGW
jgi:hypothetical protein